MFLTESAFFSSDNMNAKKSDGRIDVITIDQVNAYFYVPVGSKNRHLPDQ